MILKIDAYSNKGCIRTNNEDHLLVDQLIVNKGSYTGTFDLQQPVVLAVADGIGGHKGGEVASKMVLESLSFMASKLKKIKNYDDFLDVFEGWFDGIDNELKKVSQANKSLKGMGTTLTGLLISETIAYIFNAGDSRAYHWDGNHLLLLTHDHSSGFELGIKSHMLLNCVGPVSHPYADTEDVSHLVRKGNAFLICTDGLTDMVDDDMIAICLAEGKPGMLLQEALKEGGRDNISYIYVQIV